MVDASLAYEVLLYLDSFYFGLLAMVEVGVFTFKMVKMGTKYDKYVLISDVGFLLGTLFLETLRIILGRKGSLSNHCWQVILSVILIFPCMAGIWYLIYLQKTTILLEIVLCSLELSLLVIETFYATIFTFTACRSRSYY